RCAGVAHLLEDHEDLHRHADGHGQPRRHRLHVAGGELFQQHAGLHLSRTPAARALASPLVFRRILVGTDGSPTATVAVDRAVDVASRLGASLTILSAGPPARSEAVVEKELARLADAGVAVEGRAVDVDPATALLDAVEKDGYDLLVVGNKGMT